jgi:uncharacterized protein (DUF1501 family)
MNRRHFSKLALLSGFGAGVPLLSLMNGHNVLAQATDDYKALVCIYLFGGNDGYNTLVPYEASTHSQYLNMRPEYSVTSGTGLGLPRNALLPLQPLTGGSAHLGLHPALSHVHARWSKGQVAWIQNAGNLIEPVSRLNQNTKIHPAGLLSHIDQQEVSMLTLQDPQGTGAERGWGARLWSQWAASSGVASSDLAQISFAGQNRWQMSPELALSALFPNQTLSLPMVNQLGPLFSQAQLSAKPFVRSYAEQISKTYQVGQSVNAIFSNNTSLASGAFVTALGGTVGSLSNQLLAVARLIESRNQLQAPGRQIFFVAAGGYDTHEAQYNTHAGLLTELDRSLHGFFAAMDELGMGRQVTAFTMSDFGRTLRVNASHGTDHAWSSHMMVMGGAVKGGLYGRSADWTTGSEDLRSVDVVIPSLSIDQYGATLGAWMGLDANGLNTVFPHLRNFPQSNLGFMST